MQAKFYDHAKNIANIAQGYAVAMARRDAIAEGNAYTVEFKWSGGEAYYWNGGYYAALSLAKSCLSNRAEMVKMTGPDGKTVNIATAKY